MSTTVDEQRLQYILDAVADGSAVSHSELVAKSTQYSVRNMTARLIREGRLVTTLSLCGRFRMYFRDQAAKVAYLRQSASSKIVFPRANVSDVAPVIDRSQVELIKSAAYQPLAVSHVTGSGYRVSL